MSKLLLGVGVSEEDVRRSALEDGRLLLIEYECPRCGYAWEEHWSCACDSQCPACGMGNIMALDWREVAS